MNSAYHIGTWVVMRGTGVRAVIAGSAYKPGWHRLLFDGKWYGDRHVSLFDLDLLRLGKLMNPLDVIGVLSG